MSLAIGARGEANERQDKQKTEGKKTLCGKNGKKRNERKRQKKRRKKEKGKKERKKERIPLKWNGRQRLCHLLCPASDAQRETDPLLSSLALMLAAAEPRVPECAECAHYPQCTASALTLITTASNFARLSVASARVHRVEHPCALYKAFCKALPSLANC